MNAQELARRVDKLAWVRGGTQADGAAWKEWLHVVVLAPQGTVVVNVSLLGALATRPDARVIVLVEAGGWEGDVRRVSARDVRVADQGRGIDAAGTSITWDGAAWQVRIALDGKVSGRFRVVPAAPPTSVQRLPFGGASQVQWNVLPMGWADGEITVAGRRLTLDHAPAYQDHNHGRFDWGGDFVWEWGAFLPDQEAHPIVFSRMLDRRRLVVRAAGVMAWQGGASAQYVGDGRVSSTFAGRWAGAAMRVPRAMGIATDGGVVGVPGTITVRGGDAVEVRMEVAHVAQIAVPAERDPLGVVLVQELVGPAWGRCGRTTLTGRAIVELVRVR